MKWLYATIALLTMCVCLVAWVYLRDRDTNWRLTEHQITRTNSTAVRSRNSADDCRSGCVPQLPGIVRSHRRLLCHASGVETQKQSQLSRAPLAIDFREICHRLGGASHKS